LRGVLHGKDLIDGESNKDNSEFEGRRQVGGLRQAGNGLKADSEGGEKGSLRNSGRERGNL